MSPIKIFGLAVIAGAGLWVGAAGISSFVEAQSQPTAADQIRQITKKIEADGIKFDRERCQLSANLGQPLESYCDQFPWIKSQRSQ